MMYRRALFLALVLSNSIVLYCNGHEEENYHDNDAALRGGEGGERQTQEQEQEPEEVESIATTIMPDIIHFNGLLVDDSGFPIEGASIQFWQTDLQGTYNHPRSLNVRGVLDPTFQYFGTTTSDENGSFFFRTFKPGIYPGRPAHIHFRVWTENNTNNILTSQLYFAGENGGNPNSLTLDLLPLSDTGSLFTTSKTIAVDLGGGGDFPLTPAQASGPFYPVVDFFQYDNDITNISSVRTSPLLPSSAGTDTNNDPETTENEIPAPIVDLENTLAYGKAPPVPKCGSIGRDSGYGGLGNQAKDCGGRRLKKKALKGA